ncbi:hypothetical protein GFL89_24210 [Rhizobium leguminosarum bv. viciae]|nr:hypothetical protein [Rhizobium leguminosarum bv. viciae]
MGELLLRHFSRLSKSSQISSEGRICRRIVFVAPILWVFRSGDGIDPDTGSHRWLVHGIFA